MSVYPRKDSSFYWCDFTVGGHRIQCSTGETEERAARRWVKSEKERLKAQARAERAKPAATMTVDVAVGRYWNEVGQHGATPDLWGNLERIVDWLQPETELADVNSDLMSRLIARRRAEYRRRDPKLGLVSPSTVNRSFTMVVRRILTRARTVWAAAERVAVEQAHAR